MPKGSPELTQARREEIIAACEELYRTMGFKEITIEKIGAVTSFGRTSIYNYFQTKEEIFLAILQREYEAWIDTLDEIGKTEKVTRAELARAIARSLERREMMLKILSMNHFDMEKNSSMEALVAFKKAYGESIRAVSRLLEAFCPEMSAERRQRFLYA
ncbi:MAG: TetR family transcriptional regulator, partial [Oscillospiraceae bacterium]|nr:TetR family transcriptional regulator [Oscillospiraceae bacterium]